MIASTIERSEIDVDHGKHIVCVVYCSVRSERDTRKEYDQLKSHHCPTNKTHTWTSYRSLVGSASASG